MTTEAVGFTDAVQEYPCRICGCAFLPTAARIIKGDLMCNSCQREYLRAYRAKRKAAGNPVISGRMPREYHIQYDKMRSLIPEVKSKKAETMRIRYRNPEHRIKMNCRSMTRKAVSSGALVKLPCEVCGTSKVEAHHDDYSNHMMVRWLCPAHHREFHSKAKAKAGAA